jgi:cytochrome c2
MRALKEMNASLPVDAHRPRSCVARALRLAICALAFGASPMLGACGQDQNTVGATAVNGDPQHGRDLIQTFGCGSCHTIPGVANADSLVGPPLVSWRRRIYIAGLLRNTPDNLAFWIQHPQQVVPGNAMPDMGITARQARDIAAYLYTIR